MPRRAPKQDPVAAATLQAVSEWGPGTLAKVLLRLHRSRCTALIVIVEGSEDLIEKLKVNMN